MIVDDVTVMGATLAEMANHIRQGGGDVIGVIALANAGRAILLRQPRAHVKWKGGSAMFFDKTSELSPALSQQQKSSTSLTSRTLTRSEREELRRSAKEQSVYLRKAFEKYRRAN